MKKIVLLLFVAIAADQVNAQGLKGLIKNVTKDSSGSNPLNKVLNRSSSLSNDDLIAGLKEALEKGAVKGAERTSALDGYFANAAIKILMPAEAKKVESTLRSVGFGKQVDELVLTMNRAAENAAKEAAPIFLNAIKQMTIKDGLSILKGSDTAATQFLRASTSQPLTTAFRPIVENALSKLNASKYWEQVFNTYNRFSKEKVNTDLSAYVTEKALYGIFYQVAIEEKDIRKNPAARTTELLKKVFQ